MHTLFERIASLQNFRKNGGARVLHSAESFRAILERERARSDRNGQLFSVVVFRPAAGPRPAESNLAHLGELLGGRIRETDELGRFDDRSVAALLFGTPAEGAAKFAQDLSRSLSGEYPELSTIVFSYPSSNGYSNPGSGDGRTSSRKEGQKAGDEPSQAPLPLDASKERSALSVNEILARPLPGWKRALDILVAAATLFLLSPVFLLLALYIRIVSPGPVFYRQTRIGYLGRPFTFWKFRTMHVGSDDTEHKRYYSTLICSEKPMVKLDEKRDPRIIPLGRLIRQACLDELPQLFNVLAGDMSLVGPRPCLPNEADEYLPWHTRRFDAVPGMTGLWQVNGKNKTTFSQMIRFDIGYSKSVSPGNDVKILLRTPATVAQMVSELVALRARGAQEKVRTVPVTRRS